MYAMPPASVPACRPRFVCDALAGERVWLEELDGRLLITYGRTCVGELDLRTGTASPGLLPGPELQRMS